MLPQLETILSPVRVRQRVDRALRWGTFGLILGAILGTCWLLAHWFGMASSAQAAWIILPAGGILAAVGGLFWPTSWQSSARLIDSVYGLKDRTLTALDFAARDNRQPVHELQLDDAVEHLSDVEVAQVVPWRWPRYFSGALLATSIMCVLALLFSTQSTTVANVASGPLEVVLDQADLLEETMIEDLEELVEEIDDPRLEELAREMQQAIEELRAPDVDQREALAQLSEMQAALQAALQQLNIQQVDAQLQELAHALQVGDATAAASHALRDSQYDRAAKELEKIEASSMNRKQREALAANLTKLRSKHGTANQGELSESLEQMIEGLENDDNSKCKLGLRKAAGVCRKQGVKKRISKCLGCQLNRLATCKSACKRLMISQSKAVAKSESPSNSAGRGASNQPTGDDKTNLNSRRTIATLTGISGEGPNERETMSSAEAQQDAARSYRDRYTEYRKRMEEVIDSEPLPLGHRETVRKYFETIRPSNDQSELLDAN